MKIKKERCLGENEKGEMGGVGIRYSRREAIYRAAPYGAAQNRARNTDTRGDEYNIDAIRTS